MKALFERFDRSRRPPSPRLSQQSNSPPRPRPSSRFRGQFELALQDYEWQTGINFEHPLAKRLQGCHTVKDVMDVLREQVKGIEDFYDGNYEHGYSRLLRPLNVVEITH